MKIDGSEIADRLANAGLAAGAIHDTAQVVDHAHTKHREMVIEDGWYKMTGTPIKLSRTPGSVRHKPPKFGEHTQQILREFDFADEEIQELLSSDTILEHRQS
jgi:formyl-CoA transferase